MSPASIAFRRARLRDPLKLKQLQKGLAQLSEEGIDALLEEAFAATGATSEKEFGAVMGFVMGKAKGRVDGRVVEEKVRARLRESAG